MNPDTIRDEPTQFRSDSEDALLDTRALLTYAIDQLRNGDTENLAYTLERANCRLHEVDI